jgi:hypothetical protein
MNDRDDERAIAERWAQGLVEAERLGHVMGEPRGEEKSEAMAGMVARCMQDRCRAVVAWRDIDGDLDEREMMGPDARRRPHPVHEW